MGGLGKLIAGAGVLAAFYFGFDSYMARQDNEMLRRTRYSAVERSQSNNLMKELKKQIEGDPETGYRGAKDCLESIEKVEKNYGVFARDALKYIDDCMPKGELEDHVKEEVNGLRHFFQSTRRDNVEGRIKFCDNRYADAKRPDLTKQDLQTCVHYANEGFSEAMEHYNDRSQSITAWLPRFKRMVEHHPLKGKDRMLARIAIQMASRESLIKQTEYHKSVFDKNQDSANVIPVEPLNAE